jgi:hypothetical protein
MFKTALLVAAASIMVIPSAAYPCMNGVEYEVVPEIKIVRNAEKYVENGQYARAIKLAKRKFQDPKLRARALDMRAIASLRIRTSKDDLTWIVDHFAERSESKDGKTNLRYRAWLAEALEATGKPDEARAILVDLSKRDLMPDELAYLTLAKVSKGTERYNAWKMCRTKARNKDACELPAETVSKK